MELLGKRIAILIEDNYRALEVWYPLLRFREAEAVVIMVGPKVRSYTSVDGSSIRADASAAQVRVEDFDAIVIPGGSAAERISQQPVLLALIYEAIRQGKVVATIVRSRQPGVAGRVIREGNLIQAQRPVDLPMFCRMIVRVLSGHCQVNRPCRWGLDARPG